MKDELKLDEIERMLKQLSSKSVSVDVEQQNEPDPFDLADPNQKSGYELEAENSPTKFFEPKFEPIEQPSLKKEEASLVIETKKDKPKTFFKKQPSQGSVQVVERDRAVAISRHLESIDQSLKQICLKQNEQAQKTELGSGFGGELNYIKFLQKNLGKLSPCDALNILYEISVKFKEGDAEEFNNLVQKVMDSYDNCFKLSQLSDNVKLRPRRKNLIKKMITALNKWSESPDKKLLDEIYSLKCEGDDLCGEQFNIISTSFDNGKDIGNDLREFCGFKLSQIAEPPTLKQRNDNSATVFDVLNTVHRDLIELRYLQESSISNESMLELKNDIKAFNAIKNDFKSLLSIKDELDAFVALRGELQALNYKDEIKSLTTQLKGVKSELKSLKAQLNNANVDNANEVQTPSFTQTPAYALAKEEPISTNQPIAINNEQLDTQPNEHVNEQISEQINEPANIADEQPKRAKKATSAKKEPAKKETAKKEPKKQTVKKQTATKAKTPKEPTQQGDAPKKRGRPKKQVSEQVSQQAVEQVSEKNYDEIVSEISQLKSELTDQMQNIEKENQ